MPVYGRDSAPALAAALESILNQTMPPDEIVLVEDGPLGTELDQVITGARRQFEGRFLVVSTGSNQGIVVALNTGIRLCTGEFIFRMDADDISLPDRIERQLAVMDANPDLGVLGSGMIEFSDDPTMPDRRKDGPRSHEAIRSRLPYRNPMNHPTVCIRRNAIPREGYPKLPYVEDYFLWAKMMHLGVKFQNLAEPVLRYRFNDHTLVRRSGWVNLKSEIVLRWWMYRAGLMSLPALLLVTCVQVPLRFAPTPLRRLIWRHSRTNTT